MNTAWLLCSVVDMHSRPQSIPSFSRFHVDNIFGLGMHEDRLIGNI